MESRIRKVRKKKSKRKKKTEVTTRDFASSSIYSSIGLCHVAKKYMYGYFVQVSLLLGHHVGDGSIVNDAKIWVGFVTGRLRPA